MLSHRLLRLLSRPLRLLLRLLLRRGSGLGGWGALALRVAGKDLLDFDHSLFLVSASDSAYLAALRLLRLLRAPAQLLLT